MNIAIIERLASAGRLDRIFIGGKWVRPAGQDRNAVIDPSTEEPVTEIALGNARDVAVAVAEARRAFTTWALSSPHSRAALLDGVHGLILERTESFAQAISQEMGCAVSVARRTGAKRRRSRPRGAEVMHDAGVPAGVFNLVNGEGAQVGAALAPGRPQGLERGFYVRPTLFSDVEPQMRIAQEQIFGPVLAIIPYPPWSPDAPLGGYKRSDNGREYGIEGLEEYLETKAILGYLDGAATSVPSGRQ